MRGIKLLSHAHTMIKGTIKSLAEAAVAAMHSLPTENGRAIQSMSEAVVAVAVAAAAAAAVI